MTDTFDTPDTAPVPIAVWPAPATGPGQTMSAHLAHRLIGTYAAGRRPLIDLTTGDQVAHAADMMRTPCARHTVRSLHSEHRQAALILAGWPLPGSGPTAVLAGCAARLRAGGHLILVLDGVDFTVNRKLIAAARTAALAYTRHIVVTHAGPAASAPAVHANVLVFEPSGRPQPGTARR